MERKNKKENRKEKYILRRKRKILYKKIFAILIFLLIFIIGLLKIGFFNVKNISVEGTSDVKREEIIKRSGLKVGKNYFAISKSNRIEDIKSIPRIKSANIKFSLNGNVLVKVTERLPVLQAQKFTDYYLIDDELRVIDIKSSKVQNIPEILKLNQKKLKVGTFLFEKEENKMNFLKFLFEKKELFDTIKEINLKEDEIIFIKDDDLEINFGSYENLDYKYKMLNLIFKDIEDTKKDAVRIEMEKGSNPILIVKSAIGEK